MPIITQADLATNIYAEIITEITRHDATIADRAIATAIQETKMYLGKYDLGALFGNDRGAEPSVHDEYLKSLVKDLACWHLLRLSNATVELTIFRTAYEDAIAALKSIMSGHAQPQGWPYADTTGETTPKGDAINLSCNPKRNNFY